MTDNNSYKQFQVNSCPNVWCIFSCIIRLVSECLACGLSECWIQTGPEGCHETPTATGLSSLRTWSHTQLQRYASRSPERPRTASYFTHKTITKNLELSLTSGQNLCHLGGGLHSQSLDWYRQTKHYRKIHKLNTTQKSNQQKYSETKLHWISCLLWRLAGNEVGLFSTLSNAKKTLIRHQGTSMASKDILNSLVSTEVIIGLLLLSTDIDKWTKNASLCYFGKDSMILKNSFQQHTSAAFNNLNIFSNFLAEKKLTGRGMDHSSIKTGKTNGVRED